MRTEVAKERATIKVPTTVNYQFDDGADSDNPHIYEWRGLTGSGSTKERALLNLGLRVANETGGILM